MKQVQREIKNVLTTSFDGLNSLYDAPNEQIASIRRQFSERKVQPLERIVDTKGSASTESETIDLMIRQGWSFQQFPVLSLTPPIRWATGPRSLTFHLQALDPLETLLKGYERFEDPAYLRHAWVIAEDWIKVHQADYFACPLQEGVDDAFKAENETFVWYDMAVSQRAYRFAYLTQAIARSANYSDAEFGNLFRTVIFHFALLRHDSFFKGHSNHGVYQALGQAAAARRFSFLPGLQYDNDQAKDRYLEVVNRSFTPSGVHKEHSPGYHAGVLHSLQAARDDGLLDNVSNTMIDAAEDALAWMRQPNGKLVTIGDTDTGRHLVPSEKSGPYGVRPFYDAGYAFARFENTYLAQTAAFHSRVHKHADDLSFVWIDRDRPILIDAGRYGYEGKTEPGSELSKAGFYYSSPKRVYVEKTRAHNTVEIDGLDFPRRGVKFSGSSLKYAGAQGDLIVTSCETRHFKTVRHWRGLVLLPSQFLLVLDWIHDKAGNPHRFRQNFHLDASWNARLDDGCIRASASNETVFATSLVSEMEVSEVVRGREGDEMFGWMSDAPYSLVPSPSFSVSSTDAQPTATFATLFSFERASIEKLKIQSEFRSATFAWTTPSQQYSVNFDKSGEVPRVVLGEDNGNLNFVRPFKRFGRWLRR